MIHPTPAVVLPLSRPRWTRAADALRRIWQTWLAARRQARAFAALEGLSPAQLRDIGAGDEWVGEARYRAERQALLRNLDVYLGR